MKTLGLPLREFAYLDRERVEDFVSALLGGLPEEVKEVTVAKPSEMSASIGINSTGLSLKKGAKELTQEELKKATGASLFEKLHRILEENEATKQLDTFDYQNWDALEVEEFIEVRSKVEFSALEVLFSSIRRLMGFMEKFEPELAQDPGLKGFVPYLANLDKERDAYNIRIAPLGAPSRRFVFVASLAKDKLRANKEGLVGEYIIFGRIQRKLVKNEKFELFTLIPGIQLPREQIRDFMRTFEKMPKEVQLLGGVPEIKDLQVSYPAIILTPIAMFR